MGRVRSSGRAAVFAVCRCAAVPFAFSCLGAWCLVCPVWSRWPVRGFSPRPVLRWWVAWLPFLPLAVLRLSWAAALAQMRRFWLPCRCPAFAVLLLLVWVVLGTCPFSAVAAVSAFAGAGGSVQWWAGGSVFVPLRARLSKRTSAVVAAANAGLLVFFGSPSSRGSLLACQRAVARSLPVVAFPVGFCGSLLPSLGLGSWVAVGGVGVWFSAFLWVSAQQKCI